MAINPMNKVLEHLRRTVSPRDGAGLTDGQLLERYIHHREEAAFASLVRRHGPMVLSVCRRVLGNDHDAEDAFQASFLVLVRKAASVVPRERVANFLYGVAHTTAVRAKVLIAKRRTKEKQVAEMPEPEARPQELWNDLRPLLDQELNQLPDKYRVPIVLCDLEDRSIKEAARHLGWPQGTLAGRLARARVMLAKRLARRGLGVSGGALAVLLSQQARSACASARLISGTIEAARLFAAGQAASGLIAAPVAALTEGVLKTMFLAKLKTATAVLMVTVLALSAVGGFYKAAAGDERPAERQPAERSSSPRQPVAAAADVRRAKTDLDRLQGAWWCVSCEAGGKTLKPEKAAFIVDGKRASWQIGGGEAQGGLYLDPSSKPKTFDLATSTKTFEGIYSLDGDTLRLCFIPGGGEGGKRPTRFATKSGEQQVLFVLKRMYGPDVSDYRRADGSKTFPTIVEKADEPEPPSPPTISDPPLQIIREGYQPQTPPDTKSPAKNAPKLDSTEANGKNELPVTQMPRQALVRLEYEHLLVRTLEVSYEPIIETIKGRSITNYHRTDVMKTRHYPTHIVKVYDMSGKPIDTKQLPKLLKKEILALVAWDDPTVDPLSLRLFKEGTLLFVLPHSSGPPIALVPEAAAPVIPPESAPEDSPAESPDSNVRQTAPKP